MHVYAYRAVVSYTAMFKLRSYKNPRVRARKGKKNNKKKLDIHSRYVWCEYIRHFLFSLCLFFYRSQFQGANYECDGTRRQGSHSCLHRARSRQFQGKDSLAMCIILSNWRWRGNDLVWHCFYDRIFFYDLRVQGFLRDYQRHL